MAADEATPSVDVVELDGLVVLKIIKHCHEALPGFVTGQLLGLDIGRTLEVTNCFAFPTKDDDAGGGGKGDGDDDEDGAEYQIEMMRSLREVNVDNNTVGWYQSTYFSSFIDDSCIETQFNYQVRRSASHPKSVPSLIGQAPPPSGPIRCRRTSRTAWSSSTTRAAPVRRALLSAPSGSRTAS